MADAKKTEEAAKTADTTPAPAPSPDTSTTMTDNGPASASSPNDAGASAGTDTIDQTAKHFVESGASAKDYVKGFDAPSGDELRKEAAEVDRNQGRENIANLADGNSNHNTVAGVNPVGVAFADRPDYNPQRRPSSRANQMSSIGEAPQMMAARVDAKKEAPTNAEIVQERRDTANEERSAPLTGYQSPFMGEI